MGSDGFTGQNDTRRKKFGENRLHQVLIENKSAPLEEQKEALDKALQAYMMGTEQRDDILLIGLKTV